MRARSILMKCEKARAESSTLMARSTRATGVKISSTVVGATLTSFKTLFTKGPSIEASGKAMANLLQKVKPTAVSGTMTVCLAKDRLCDQMSQNMTASSKKASSMAKA